MAKTSSVAKNNRREKTVIRYAERRAELKKIIKKSKDYDEVQEAITKLQKLPRNASPIRVRSRCQLTGRPRGNYKKFKLSRIAFRELALEGLLPGVTKASW